MQFFDFLPGPLIVVIWWLGLTVFLLGVFTAGLCVGTKVKSMWKHYQLASRIRNHRRRFRLLDLNTPNKP